ncbi:hypothetical protein KW795_02895 [Candidatus Microgenomates bacterium]|nr:hypothetical protein [Candidatus Microgenomates bacterium]
MDDVAEVLDTPQTDASEATAQAFFEQRCAEMIEIAKQRGAMSKTAERTPRATVSQFEFLDRAIRSYESQTIPKGTNRRIVIGWNGKPGSEKKYSIDEVRTGKEFIYNNLLKQNLTKEEIDKDVVEIREARRARLLKSKSNPWISGAPIKKVETP